MRDCKPVLLAETSPKVSNIPQPMRQKMGWESVRLVVCTAEKSDKIQRFAGKTGGTHAQSY
jgi:hypothetical protein